MIKKILLTLVSAVMMALMPVSLAFAWSYSMTGQGDCQPDGSYKITWTVNNPEQEDMTIRVSSDATTVPVGTVVPKNDSKTFMQTVDGTQPGSWTLTLKANWPGDMRKQEKSATVQLTEPCTQPTPPVDEGGRGGDPLVEAEEQVVVAPTVVRAGDGGGSGTAPGAAIVGMLASVALLGIGLRRLAYQQRG